MGEYSWVLLLGWCKLSEMEFIIMCISVALKEVVHTVVVILFPASYPKEKLKFNTKIYM